MARDSAPPSATGGVGYNYADKVAAKYLLDMLGGRSPFGPEYGQIVRVDWETRDEALGWLVDDLRLTLRDGNTDRFVAASLNSPWHNSCFVIACLGVGGGGGFFARD